MNFDDRPMMSDTDTHNNEFNFCLSSVSLLSLVYLSSVSRLYGCCVRPMCTADVCRYSSRRSVQDSDRGTTKRREGKERDTRNLCATCCVIRVIQVVSRALRRAMCRMWCGVMYAMRVAETYTHADVTLLLPLPFLSFISSFFLFLVPSFFLFFITTTTRFTSVRKTRRAKIV